MGTVPRSAYRQPVTPGGLKAIESGELSWLQDEMYNNLNTGILEQYLEEKNLKESWETSHWSTGKVITCLIIGAVFSGVTAYIGLKIGLAISAAWYVAYLIGMALRWTPSEVNVSTSTTLGAAHASTGFIFTFPAIFLLASSDKYLVKGEHLISDPNVWQLAFIGIIASMFAGFLGVMYFVIFRRVWLVEDPLPMPGFEATVKLLDIASDISSGASDQAKSSLRTVGLWTGITMFMMFLIDYPIFWARHLAHVPASLLDWVTQFLSGEKYGLSQIYSERWIHQPTGLDTVHGYGGVSEHITHFSKGNIFSYTYLGIEISPTLFAIGWFMRLRVALLVNLGTLAAWFYLVPIAVGMNVPVYDAAMGGYFNLRDYAECTAVCYPAIQWKAYLTVVRIIAIGSILGGGIFGLLKMSPTFIGIFGDIAAAFRGESGQEYVEGKGWYEWPLNHIPIFMGITGIAMVVIFLTGGYPFLASLIFTVILLATTFLLGAIAVRVMGETGIEPVSGTSFIVLLLLLGIFIFFQDALSLSKEEAILLGLVGTTVFGSAISMSGSLVGVYKNGIYVGDRPYYLAKGTVFGVVPGAILGAGVAIFLSDLLASGKIDLLAPQANAFASFTIILAEQEGDLYLLLLGALLGVFVEWATGMGTSFGLGMYMPTPVTFPMLIGGGLRDWWEAKRLNPRVEAAGGDEKLRSILLLGTFMVGAGAFTGEAFFGIEQALLSAIDELEVGGESLSSLSWWPAARFAAFLVFNGLLGVIVFVMLKKAGLIGKKDEVDADLAVGEA